MRRKISELICSPEILLFAQIDNESFPDGDQVNVRILDNKAT